MKNTNERQNVTEKYRSLSASDRIVFKSILDLAVILLKGSQEQQEKKGA
ncbi:MAG: hypothetical protein NC485_03975 [Ruminococcus flavefaciens]|nr:hypothetical protein [Ruminococcus flavefaciens]MCM1062580.1 hypothetical protein [Eubacterium sp.]